jgi:hypothetical protein
LILTIVVLLAGCALARYLFLRSTENIVASNAAAAAIFAAFVIGSFAHTFALPEVVPAGPVAPSPTDPPAVSSDAPVAAATPARQSDGSLKNVSARCRNAAGTSAVDAVGAIDVFNNDEGTIRAADGVQLDRSRRYDLEGWAAARGSKAPALAACLVIDGSVAEKVVDLFGVRRADVANALGSAALVASGYRIVIPQEALSPGTHAIRDSVLEQDGTFAFIGPRSIQITSQ